MRTKRMLVPVLLMAILLTSIPVAFSNGNGQEPGYSPGYWKHQCKAWVLGRGHLHETGLEGLAASFGYEVQDAYDEFTTGNNADGHWTWLANQFNAAAGYGPYEE